MRVLSALGIAWNCDKILHLASKWTMWLVKLWVLNFFLFCVCKLVQSKFLFGILNDSHYFTCLIGECHLYFSIYKDTNSILVQFSNRQKNGEDYALGISLFSVNHYLSLDVTLVKMETKLLAPSFELKNIMLECGAEISHKT